MGSFSETTIDPTIMIEKVSLSYNVASYIPTEVHFSNALRKALLDRLFGVSVREILKVSFKDLNHSFPYTIEYSKL